MHTSIAAASKPGTRHPDADLLALCVRLAEMQAEWQRLWEPTCEDWGLDDPPVTEADHIWLRYNDHVWPGIHISGQTRSPQWDRLALDALFTNKPTHRSLEQAEQDAVNAIIKRAREGRQKTIGRRVDQGIPLRQ